MYKQESIHKNILFGENLGYNVIISGTADPSSQCDDSDSIISQIFRNNMKAILRIIKKNNRCQFKVKLVETKTRMIIISYTFLVTPFIVLCCSQTFSVRPMLNCSNRLETKPRLIPKSSASLLTSRGLLCSSRHLCSDLMLPRPKTHWHKI